ncbi:MAG TPA: glycoside hydrolase family 36 protein [Candidatus Binataceae bacterium]|nr:glycoside hydrolase family 36 protein [Candidatus Binataceae bacterium]
MIPARIELRFRDGTGVPQVLALGRGQMRAEEGGIVLDVRKQSLERGTVVRVAISNRSDRVIRLDSVSYDLPTGFSAHAPARFFKHGYQSWSASYPVTVGTVAHPRDSKSPIARLTHQSEVSRPTEAPEAATSELFTIVESDASPERFFAGFIGAASQLTTITVKSPEQVSARSLLDGATLGPGQSREVEPLVSWHSGLAAAGMAARWAAMLGQTMAARVSAPYLRGWCSWYHYFHAITEDALISNVRVLKEMRSEFPVEVVQLDDGYQAALGDWDRTNAKFPSGLKRIAGAIRAAGFAAGLWTAPFLAARDSQVMRDHPDWLITDNDGAPLRAAYNPNWTPHEDKFAYALDPSDPALAAHLERLFRTIVHEFGYDYLKLDFLFAAAAEGLRHDPALTRAETLRRGLEAIRRGAGERAFILGCGCPLGPAVGILDGMRIGPDVAPYWGAGGAEPGTALAIDAIVARSFMHRRLWLNDPDCVMLRARETRLSTDEREALAWTVATSGGMLLISDDMSLLSQESARLFRAVAGIGAEVDRACLDEPPAAATLMDRGELKILSARTRDGFFHLLTNMSDHARNIRLADVLPAYAFASVIELEGETNAGEQLELPPHSARIIRAK